MKHHIVVCKSTKEPYTKFCIESRINALGIGDRFGSILVPCSSDHILYSGYIFVEMFEDDIIAHYVVSCTPGVIKILGDNRFVSEEEMEVIKRRMMVHSEMKYEEKFVVGDAVAITGGSLNGINGIVTGMKNKRIMVEVRILGRSVPTEVSKEFLRKV